jgi:hypothetical protein
MNIDEKIDQLIEQINKKKAAISKAEKSSRNTNCSFSYTEKPGDAINLHVEKDIAQLTKIVGFLLYREQAYKNGAEHLSIKAPPFKWQGYSTSDWIEDVRVRITKIQIDDEKKKLEQLEARLDKIISPEKRRELELAAILSELE